MLTIDIINQKLNDGLNRTESEMEQCKKRLYEFYTANDMSLNELNDLCFSDSDWVFNQIFN